MIRKRILFVLAAAALLFGLLNLLAYRQAYAMVHFQEGVSRTASPENLSPIGKAKTLLLGVKLPRPESRNAPASCDVFSVETEDNMTLECWRMAHPEPTTQVVLFHGYGGSKLAMWKEAEALHDLGCEVVLVDFRGHGGSDGSTTSLGVHEAGDVATVYRHLQSEPSDVPIVLLGQSMGSAAILRAVQEYDIRPDGIVLEACFDRLLSTVGNRFHAMGLPAFPLAHLLLFWGGVQVDAGVTRHNPVEYAASFAGPALVMHGANDPRATLAEAKNVYNALPGRKEWVEFDAAGHESYVNTDRAKWIEAMRQFLGTINQPPDA